MITTEVLSVKTINNILSFVPEKARGLDLVFSLDPLTSQGINDIPFPSKQPYILETTDFLKRLFTKMDYFLSFRVKLEKVPFLGGIQSV
ncbi:hypothetical protein J7J00_21040 [Bacillus sp. ISL-4]|uniref:hypothetical protein n=1 Tax=Bacillus sp. ISL-4 TaxID=2819125 RepID=UPI001BEAC351|nr:hypothetical protein [Bacillus sp. ISL-4]MBT2667936.1 hypothetical protein [Bacillus sp. ISL-4]MBT2672697.1 hypothetical protein [Streptomyces sp. ISL-14]